MTSKHTPGPWVVQDETVVWTAIIDPPETSYDIGTPIADMRTSKSLLGPAYTRDEVAANARLISAAPDMYEALKDLVTSVEALRVVGLDKEIELARAALSKAEGGGQ